MAEQEQQQGQQQPEAQQEQKPATPAAEPNKSDNPSQEQTVPYARFKEVNDRLKALEDEAAKRTREQQAAEEKRMAEQQEWQKLADSRKAKVEELTPKAELADKLSALVLEQYTAEIAAWPEQVRNMAPGDEADVLTKLDWMKRAKPLALQLMADKTPTPGNGPKPKPMGSAGSGQQEQRARTEQATWTRRQF